ncbi:MAG: phosphonate C-P lyase system protein PhnG [Pseudomonadota bacterium]
MKKKSPQPEVASADVLLNTAEAVDRKILQLLAEASVAIRREPATGLVMMTVADGVGTDFHLGEVLVTEAEVEYEGKIGYGMVVGNNPEKAVVRAGVSAMMESADSPYKARLYKYLVREARKISAKERITEALSASTKVNFESMTPW